MPGGLGSFLLLVKNLDGPPGTFQEWAATPAMVRRSTRPADSDYTPANAVTPPLASFQVWAGDLPPVRTPAPRSSELVVPSPVSGSSSSRFLAWAEALWSRAAPALRVEPSHLGSTIGFAPVGFQTWSVDPNPSRVIARVAETASPVDPSVGVYPAPFLTWGDPAWAAPQRRQTAYTPDVWPTIGFAPVWFQTWTESPSPVRRSSPVVVDGTFPLDAQLEVFEGELPAWAESPYLTRAATPRVSVPYAPPGNFLIPSGFLAWSLEPAAPARGGARADASFPWGAIEPTLADFASWSADPSLARATARRGAEQVFLGVTIGFAPVEFQTWVESLQPARVVIRPAETAAPVDPTTGVFPTPHVVWAEPAWARVIPVQRVDLPYMPPGSLGFAPVIFQTWSEFLAPARPNAARVAEVAAFSLLSPFSARFLSWADLTRPSPVRRQVEESVGPLDAQLEVFEGEFLSWADPVRPSPARARLAEQDVWRLIEAEPSAFLPWSEPPQQARVSTPRAAVPHAPPGTFPAPSEFLSWAADAFATRSGQRSAESDSPLGLAQGVFGGTFVQVTEERAVRQQSVRADQPGFPGGTRIPTITAWLQWVADAGRQRQPVLRVLAEEVARPLSLFPSTALAWSLPEPTRYGRVRHAESDAVLSPITPLQPALFFAWVVDPTPTVSTARRAPESQAFGRALIRFDIVVELRSVVGVPTLFARVLPPQTVSSDVAGAALSTTSQPVVLVSSEAGSPSTLSTDATDATLVAAVGTARR